MTRRSHLRASDADRELTIDRLHKASTEGRIAHDELEQRVSRALKALTYGELEETVADLPGPGARRVPSRRAGGGAGWALSVVRENPLLIVLAIPVLAVATAMLLAATILWATIMVVVMILGGRPHPGRSPWAHARRHGYGPPRRRTRSARGYWA